jgi:hypothetical protein
MNVTIEETGLEVTELTDFPEFAERRVHGHDVARQMEGMQRLVKAFVDDPETILQTLVEAAVELCGADSAGMSFVLEGGTEEKYWFWAATAGEYSGFKNAFLPRYPSACGITLERKKPQHFTVRKRFFDILGVEAPLVTDGILLPWEVDGQRGTIFVMAHGRTEAFDASDARMMQTLADFAAMAVRHQRQQKALVMQTSAMAASAMANGLAHEINNPLQSLMNLIHLMSDPRDIEETRRLGKMASEDVLRLSQLVRKLLVLPRAGAVDIER